MTAAPRTSLLPVAAFVCLLVVMLGCAGLFALHHSQTRLTVGLARIDATEQALLVTLRTRAAFKTQVQEWKNILLRGHDAGDLATYRTNFETEEAIVRQGLDQLAQSLPALGLDAASLASVEPTALLAEHERLASAYRAALGAFDPTAPGAPIRADQAVRGIDRALSDGLDALADAMETVAVTELARLTDESAVRHAALRRIVWIVAAVAVLAALWLCFLAERAARGTRA